ncbi:amidase [Kushneria sinocarnis]|uniref:Amidase n=1 Tax=Kushneria sinocarnis TaxID=595502 RepID=A0A420X0W1_9GAMM|nr:amidase family protein [Kushneria sinocarnis]RKR07498.1 amidase [Kushneria sinocarnis]
MSTQPFPDRSVWVEGAPEPVATAGASGPLAGLRLAVKDLFDVKGRVTGAGNPDWRGEQTPAGQDASAVAVLRAAGACFVGKTQTDELAYSLNGANMHYGTPLNPAAPDRLPGGSSSGSAVAVAQGEADIGLGTDTGGSIRVPASYNGLFGLRPSHGVMATEGLVPLAPPFDTVGWLCRDLATLGAVAETLLPGAPVEADSDLQLLLPEGAPAELAHRMTRYLPERPTGSIGLTQAWLSHVSQTFRVLQGRAIWRTHGDWITRCQPRARIGGCSHAPARRAGAEAIRRSGRRVFALPVAGDIHPSGYPHPVVGFQVVEKAL